MADKALTLLNGTTADANEVMLLFDPLYFDIAPSNVGVLNKLGTGKFVLESALGAATLPPGIILPFYDFNGATTFDAAIYKYCDGSVINSPGSPIDGQTLPDLSGRYLVGFGTDGGGDIDTAPWNAAAVGNATHQVNLQHSHTVNNHNHSIGSHLHAINSLTNVIDKIAGGARFQVDFGGHFLDLNNGVSIEGDHSHPIVTDTEQTNLGNTGNTSPGTNNQLSTTQSIQPRSIRVRYIMKVAA